MPLCQNDLEANSLDKITHKSHNDITKTHSNHFSSSLLRTIALFAITTSYGTSQKQGSSGNESVIICNLCHGANRLRGQFGTVHDRIDCNVAISKLLGPEMSRISAFAK